MSAIPTKLPLKQCEPALVRQNALRQDWLLVLILAVCAGLPYITALFNSFVHDDLFQVLQNPYVRDSSHVRQIFTSSVWAFSGINQSNYYRPMMTLGYLICHSLFGFAPFAFHAFNLLLHISIVCLLFYVTRRIFLSSRLAFWAAFIFALHPIHSEAVVWIAAVTELELTFFYLLTLWFFLDLDRSKGKRALWTFGAMAAAFACTLLSKEQALTLPLVAVIYEHFYRPDRSETGSLKKLSRYAPLWLLAIAYLPWRAYCLGGFAPSVKLRSMTLYESVLSAIALVGQYLGKLMWPAILHGFYLFQKSTTLWDMRVGLGLLACLISLGVFLILRKRSPASFGVVWIFLTLAPVLNAKWLGTNVFTERYEYLPSVGFSWVASVAVLYLLSTPLLQIPLIRNIVYGAVVGVALLSSYRIITRSPDWRDNLVFYSRTVAALPNTPDGNELRLNLAVERWKQGDLIGAEKDLRLMLKIEPDRVNALNNIGAILLEEGRVSEALAILSRAVKLNPAFASARANLGVAYMRSDMLEAAEAELHAAITAEPKNERAYLNLAQVYARRGELGPAERAFHHALSLAPGDGSLRLYVASFYEGEGRKSDAVREYRAVLEADPSNSAARTALERLVSTPPVQ